MGLVGFRRDNDMGAVTRGAQGNSLADAAAGAGDEERFARKGTGHDPLLQWIMRLDLAQILSQLRGDLSGKPSSSRVEYAGSCTGACRLSRIRNNSSSVSNFKL